MPTSMGSPTTQTLPNLSTNTGPSFILDPSISGHHPSIPSISGHHPTTYHSPANRPIFRRTQAELQEQHQKGMCFSYDEAYSPSHRCKQPHILMIESESLLDRRLRVPNVSTQVPARSSSITRVKRLSECQSNSAAVPHDQQTQKPHLFVV
ncbi:hypothetical protein GBA52_004301 [Prunus armeniaca]|nr:hypothetical protein GBA52_004301 [Prunus armeniaca]